MKEKEGNPISKQTQFRRGTTAEHSSFTGAVGEVTVDTSKDTAVVHDGSTAGGHPLALEKNVPNGANSAITDDGTNITITNGALKGSHGGGNVSSNTAVGDGALHNNITGYNNTANGRDALVSNTTGYRNTANGQSALYNNTTGNYNTANGQSALYNNTTGNYNTANGRDALRNNTTGNYNTANGVNALRNKQNGTNNTDLTNCSGLGCNTRVSGSNQVQLGDSTTTTYVYGTVQNRSDARDKADIETTSLGLNFINKIRPVEYKWDMRDDYFDTVEETITREVEKTRIVENPDFNPELEESEVNQRQLSEVYAETEEYIETKLVPVTKDGSRARNRKHQGVIAQEVKEVMEELGVDFGGYQDHSVNGGTDVCSIGYDEFIAPLIKAVQELSARVVTLEELAE